MAELIYLVPLLPLIGFFIIGFFGNTSNKLLITKFLAKETNNEKANERKERNEVDQLSHIKHLIVM